MPYLQIKLDRNRRKAADSTKKTTQVRLAAKSLLRLEGNRRGLTVLCHSGLCWITQERDPKDYLLKNEERFTTNRDGLVLVQALADTELIVRPLEEKALANHS
jgi:hypothetical protein